MLPADTPQWLAAQYDRLTATCQAPPATDA
jgi:hypothetical protein